MIFACDSQLATECQDHTDVVDDGGIIDAVVIDLSKVFDVVTRNILLVNRK